MQTIFSLCPDCGHHNPINILYDSNDKKFRGDDIVSVDNNKISLRKECGYCGFFYDKVTTVNDGSLTIMSCAIGCPKCETCQTFYFQPTDKNKKFKCKTCDYVFKDILKNINKM